MYRHLMLVPSLDCPANCAYCFGPHAASTSMSPDTLEGVIRWQNNLNNDQPLEITFHGGEPLIPGSRFYEMALPLLRRELAPRRVRFAIQSNLWLLTDELAEILKQNRVSLGTSLDGPKWITDAQRGKGYYQRTMDGIRLAREHGLDVGCICTFTKQSLQHKKEILSFFINAGLNLSLHVALPGLSKSDEKLADKWSLSPQEHGDLLLEMFDLYLEQADQLRISSLDALCRSVGSGHGSICTFEDCLGKYLAVGPDGAIYPCQRFAGKPEFVLANVHAPDSLLQMTTTSVWHMFQERQERISEECGSCTFLAICRGGCPYNVLAEGRGTFKTRRDPHCSAYKQIFSEISNRAMAEVFSKENMDLVVNQPNSEKGLLRTGRLISIMDGKDHPYDSAHRARLILAAVALGTSGSPEGAARHFERLGLSTHPDRTLAGMQSLHQRLSAPVQGLNNCYLHITFACPLHCSHCYAKAASSRSEFMPMDQILLACRQASEAGFRQAVITGGEPLIHPQREALLNALSEIRQKVKPMLTVLRTSLSFPSNDELLRQIGSSTDEVAVSLDGDRQTHDARRGSGSYGQVVANLRRMVALGYTTRLSLAAVLPLEQAKGAPGKAVRSLARELGVRAKFRPILPIGRAAETGLETTPQPMTAFLELDKDSKGGFQPVATCGIGQNLYIEPDGRAFPCYAWHGETWMLGRLDARGGLSGIIASPAFKALGRHTVDTNHACHSCTLRYLCGGACRAWTQQNPEAQVDLDLAPRDCSHLRDLSQMLFLSALQDLGLSEEHWQQAVELNNRTPANHPSN